MKKISKWDAVRMLKNAGFYLDRTSKHEVWKDATGKFFPLPSHKEISPGVVRQLKKLISRN